MNRRVLWCFRGDNSDISRDFVVLAGRGPVTRGFPAGRRWGFGVPIPFNPNSEIGRGGTGDPPVSSGHWPDETATRAAHRVRTLLFAASIFRGALKRHYRAVANQGGTGHWPVPSGDPPDGTGEALCLPAETVSHVRPAPLSRAGSPAGWASGLRASFGFRDLTAINGFRFPVLKLS
jgi:hypothetical protein